MNSPFINFDWSQFETVDDFEGPELPDVSRQETIYVSQKAMDELAPLLDIELVTDEFIMLFYDEQDKITPAKRAHLKNVLTQLVIQPLSKFASDEPSEFDDNTPTNPMGVGPVDRRQGLCYFCAINAGDVRSDGIAICSVCEDQVVI